MPRHTSLSCFSPRLEGSMNRPPLIMNVRGGRARAADSSNNCSRSGVLALLLDKPALMRRAIKVLVDARRERRVAVHVSAISEVALALREGDLHDIISAADDPDGLHACVKRDFG